MAGFQIGPAIRLVDNVIDKSGYVAAYLENSGSNDMGVDGSSSPVTFSYSPTGGFNFVVGRLLIYMESGSAFDSTKFMHLDALGAGVQIYAGSTLITTWKDNIDVVADMFDMEEGAAFAKSGKVLRSRWSLYKASNVSSGILIKDGESISAKINDDLSVAGIIFRIKVQGVKISISDWRIR